MRTLRVLVRWRVVEPEAGTFDWSRLDRLAIEAGVHGVELLPFVYGSPGWVAEPESRPPLDSPAARDAWRSFLIRIVDRYGPGGELAAFGAAPIRRWQVWNEPNFDFYWSPAPDPREYARLLRISARTIRATDPRARVIAAGLAPVAAGTEWSAFLRRLYRVRSFRKSFDALALHPYAVRIEGLRARIAQAREIMAEHGDRRTPLALTEVGWSSGTDRAAPLVVGPRSQARNLERAFAVAGERRFRVSEIDWYAWQDTERGRGLLHLLRASRPLRPRRPGQAGLAGVQARCSAISATPTAGCGLIRGGLGSRSGRFLMTRFGGSSRPSAALVVAVIALAFAITGVGYAATKIGTKQIERGAVTTKKLDQKAVTGGKLASGAVKGGKIKTERSRRRSSIPRCSRPSRPPGCPSFRTAGSSPRSTGSGAPSR